MNPVGVPWETVGTVIGNVGFPIVVAVYLLWRYDKKFDQRMNGLTENVRRLTAEMTSVAVEMARTVVLLQEVCHKMNRRE